VYNVLCQQFSKARAPDQGLEPFLSLSKIAKWLEPSSPEPRIRSTTTEIESRENAETDGRTLKRRISPALYGTEQHRAEQSRQEDGRGPSPKTNREKEDRAFGLGLGKSEAEGVSGRTGRTLFNVRK
jgi:hypothetical protein